MAQIKKSHAASLLKFLLVVYLVVLVASHITRAFSPKQFPYLQGQQFVDVYEVNGTEFLSSTVSMAYKDYAAEDPHAPVLVILHGSPVASSSLMNIARSLEGHYRLIVPDLPGFGGSTLEVEDYSVLAHAYYLDQLMNHLGIDEFHLAGYSMG